MGDDRYANPEFIYGGDLGNYPHDGNFCVDGLVYPDRRPHSGLLEYKQAIKPFYVDGFNAETGEFDVTGLAVTDGLADSFWLPVIIVSAICAVICAGLLVARARMLRAASKE